MSPPTVPLRQFVLKVHSRCDLACDHCYVYHGADQSWERRPKAMTGETIAWTAQRIAVHAKKQQAAICKWHHLTVHLQVAAVTRLHYVRRRHNGSVVEISPNLCERGAPGREVPPAFRSELAGGRDEAGHRHCRDTV